MGQSQHWWGLAEIRMSDQYLSFAGMVQEVRLQNWRGVEMSCLILASTRVTLARTAGWGSIVAVVLQFPEI